MQGREPREFSPAGAGQAARADQLLQRTLLLQVPARRPHDPLGLPDHLVRVVAVHGRALVTG
jgi:hypothetical protein